ncbi:UNVERIFIED_CONTAM: hypothetical protein O8I53_07390 [Campylobacter lari]
MIVEDKETKELFYISGFRGSLDKIEIKYLNKVTNKETVALSGK